MTHSFGPLLKRWRHTRRLSQEQLAFEAGISTRHLSCLETGKANPSREMVAVLSAALALELKERNVLLTGAGFAPQFTSSGLDSLSMAPIRRAIDLMMAQQEPYGCLLLDRVWNLMRMNAGALRMMRAFMPEPPADERIAMNVVRAVLHPTGLRRSIVNWPEAASQMLERIDHECQMFPHDAERLALRDEVRQYPGVASLRPVEAAVGASPVALVHLRRGEAEARLFTTVTTLGTPLDVTAQELAIESYFPADEATERWLRKLASEGDEM